VRPWSYKEFEGRAVDVTEPLAKALNANPFLRVFLALGRYDGGVPAEAVLHSMDHLAIPLAARERIETHIYPAGHMMYIHNESRIKESEDLVDFVHRASNR